MDPKVPPHSREAEVSLLGGLLIDKEAIVRVDDVVSSEDFYEDRHQLIYTTVNELYQKHQAIDILTVSNALKDASKLDQIGGTSYLAELTNQVPTGAHVEEYAGIVRTKALHRRLIAVGQVVVKLGYQEAEEINQLIEQAETELFKVSHKHIKQDIASMEKILADSFTRLDELYHNKGQLRGVPTGFKDLDNLLAGFQASDLFVLAARPAMGKTALAVNLAYNVAVKSKLPVLYFSLEMSKEQLADRLLSVESGVNAWKIRTGNLSDTDFEKIGQAMGVLAETNLYLDDSVGVTISQLRTKARREMNRHQLGLIIVDYLQLMAGSSRFNHNDNRVQEISEISRGLKLIARELNVPVLAVSQLSRMVESRSPPHPMLSDLRDSGSIEQDADVVAFMYRDDYYNPENTKKPNIVDIMIKKHRNGPTGKVEIYFDKDKQRYRSLAKQTEPVAGADAQAADRI